MSRRYQQLQGVAQPIELPVPVGGLNTRESRSSMQVTDAIFFENMISEPQGVVSRLGYEELVTGITGDVVFLDGYSNTTTKKLLIGAGITLYDVASGGGVANSVKVGFTATNFKSAQISGSAVLVNGLDAPQVYNGTTSVDAVYSGDLLTDGPSNMDGINSHKSRLYLWDTTETDFYYGTTGAIQGAFTKFPLNQVSKSGGNLLMMKSISRDGGSGLDDVAAFILDTGEVLIYEGSDPGDANNWSLVGRYFIPPPVNGSSAVEFAGDVVILTREDIVSLNDTINASTAEGSVLLKPSKLAGAIKNSFSLFGANATWQLSVYNKRGWLIVNVPISDNTSYQQYVVVLSTQAPSLFTGWNANTFCSFDSILSFGQGNVIYKADSGFSDNEELIPIFIQQAFTTLGVPVNKAVKSLVITYLFDGSLSFGANVTYDYSDKAIQATTESSVTGSEWDTSDWDTSDWAGNIQSRNARFSINGVGRTASVLLKANISGAQFKWLGSNLTMIPLSKT